ncbi:MAG: hypothetical protein ACAH81_02660 [Actinomycetota bacterium]
MARPCGGGMYESCRNTLRERGTDGSGEIVLTPGIAWALVNEGEGEAKTAS